MFAKDCVFTDLFNALDLHKQFLQLLIEGSVCRCPLPKPFEHVDSIMTDILSCSQANFAAIVCVVRHMVEC